MKFVELVPGVKSSALAFGCGPVMGSIDRRTSEHAMHVAFDLGVNHFDVAPAYGYGQAEGVLGAFVASRRNEVVLATKFGFAPSLAARLGSPLKPVARKLLRAMGRTSHQRSGKPAGEGAHKSRLATQMLRRLAINAADLKSSLEQSLARLRTDRVDYLLLHEPFGPIVEIDEVLQAGASLKAEGKILGLGISLMLADIAPHVNYLEEFDVVQTNAPTDAKEAGLLLSLPRGKGLVLFSPFGARPAGLPAEEMLAGLRAGYADAVIICSMFTERHIRTNAHVFTN